MTKKQFKDFLARAVKEGFMTVDNAGLLLAKFGRGQVPANALSLPLPQAVQQVKNEKDARKDLAGLLVLLRKLKITGIPAEVKDVDEVLALPYATRARMREGLQTNFNNSGRAFAAVYALNRNVPGWQRSFTDLVRANLVHQTYAGVGGPLTTKQLKNLSAVVTAQTAYASRFGDHVSSKALLGATYTQEGMASRSELYSGQGRAEWYKGSEAELGYGYVVDYIALGDACDPCTSAAVNGPYLPELGPFPGEVCLGGGRCRCDRVTRLDHETHDLLLKA